MQLKKNRQMQPVRLIQVRFLSPTNYRGARIQISDLYYTECRITLAYDYAKGDSLLQAAEFCEASGLEVIGQAESRKAGKWMGYLVVNGFEKVF